uniref:Uncharacterized protein n=1 Tax=viral metagenome TaxID=1070528 RepID=A0A6C0AYU3_9ZZZZ
MHERNPSFIIIDIEGKMPSKEIKAMMMKNALEKINKEEFILRKFVNYIYYFFSYYFPFLRILFCKKYKITQIIVFEKKEFVSLAKTELYLYDKGIYFNKLLVPYENILSFGEKQGYLILEIFAKADFEDTKVSISLNDSIIKMAFKTENVNSLFKNVRINMFYHIKYNQVNEKVIDYYYLEKKKN